MLFCLPSCRPRHCLLIGFVLATCIGGSSALAISCKITPIHQPSDAETAFLRGDYDGAATLYQAQIVQSPGNADLIAGLAQVYLRQEKVKEADDLVQKSLSEDPKSAILLTAMGEVQYREGKPWFAGASVDAAMKLDPCYPQLRLLYARLLRLSSLYGSAVSEIKVAHILAPHDPRVSLSWLDTLPLSERIAELQAYLSSGTGDDPETTKSLNFYLEYLKKQLVEPHKTCRLVSTSETATISFAPLLSDANHIRAFGLDVKFNDHSARLEIDTGASGLVVSRSVAERAGLKQFSHMDMGGIGSQGRKSGYTAFADDIKIGSLEFRDCEVDVIDQRNVAESEGLIGMDVFSHFLVTLDYPMRKLLLASLPQRPDEVAEVKPTLKTTNDPSEEDSTTNPVPGSTQTAPSASKPVSHGPRDRYIAPEMKDWTHVYRIGHNLLLPASLNGTPERMFILDTGAFSTTVSPDVAREVTKIHGEDNITVRGISGKVDKVYTADNIEFRFANIGQKVQDVVAFATPSLNKNLGMEISGLIGYTALGQMTISIDYRDGLVKFAYDPNRGYRFTR